MGVPDTSRSCEPVAGDLNLLADEDTESAGDSNEDSSEESDEVLDSDKRNFSLQKLNLIAEFIVHISSLQKM